MNDNLKKGMFNVLIANIINLLLSLITSFVLPKYLSISTYSFIKTFQLYCTYAGLFHLGYVDGMYLKYGGKNPEDIDKNDFLEDLSTMRIFQLIVTITFATLGVIVKDSLIIVFALSIMPQNMNSYFRYLYQSIGSFERYKNVLNITNFGVFISNIILLFVLKSDVGLYYCISYLLIYLITWIILEANTSSELKSIKVKSFSWKYMKKNINMGIFLMLGTFSSIILTSIDRWFVKFTLTNFDFAQYSFAVSMDNFINVMITPITITLFNYFCKLKNQDYDYSNIKHYVSLFGAFLISSAFVIKFILEGYLRKYINASMIVFFLFGAQLFFISVKGVYVNLYKVRNQQKKYFFKLSLVILMGILLNIICFKIYPHKEAYAFGTLLSALLWYAISISDFRDVKHNLLDIIYPVIEIAAFVLCGIKFNAITGFITYASFTLVFSFICYKENLLRLLMMFKKKIGGLKND